MPASVARLSATDFGAFPRNGALDSTPLGGRPQPRSAPCYGQNRLGMDAPPIRKFTAPVKTPERTTAAAFSCYSHGEVAADSAALHWQGIYARRLRFPRIVDRFLVPATPEPLISCVIGGTCEFQERDLGEPWITRRLQRGDIFVTRSAVPYELRFESPAGQELDSLVIHLGVDRYLSALEKAFPGGRDQVEVVDFFGRDESLAHVCFACAEMLAKRVPAESARVVALVQLIGAILVERYVKAGQKKPEFHGGLPIHQLRKVEDHVRDHLSDEISVERMAEVADLSPFHFSRVFKQTTGMTPLQFVTRERVTRAQQLIRETSRSLIEIGLEVGYGSASHFAQVFRRIAGVTPRNFRSAL